VDVRNPDVSPRSGEVTVAIEYNDVEAYQDDQFVVEMRDFTLVRNALQSWHHLEVIELERSSDLDLVLVQISTSPGTDHPATASSYPAWRTTSTQTPDRLDGLLEDLRRRFEATSAGWAPTMDTNRLLDAIFGWPYIKGGNEKMTPACPVSIPRAGQRPCPKVVVLDTRLYAHPSLAGAYHADAYREGETPTLSTAGHATFIAGIIMQRAAAGGQTVPIDLDFRTVLDEDAMNASSWDVAKKIAELQHDEDVAVANLSFGAAAGRGAPLVLQRAIDRIASKIVVVAAAGNNRGIGEHELAGLERNTPMWPAALDNVIAVGAHDGHGKAADFSPDVSWLDLMAPGVHVTSTFLPGRVEVVHHHEDGRLVEKPDVVDFGDGWAQWNGTSFAAANVTGEIVALMNAHHISAMDAAAVLLERTGPLDGDTIWAPSPDVDASR
jgi:subtilisin family serine protease